MSNAELVDFGASGLDEETNAPWWQCKGPEVSEGVAPDYGKTPAMNALGLSARPAPADERGTAQGVVINVAGYDGVCIAGWDPRCSDVFGKIEPGETALHATGKDFDSRVLCKDQMVAIVVKDDMTTVWDRKRNQVGTVCAGYACKVSEEDGWLFLDRTGTAGIQIKDGCVFVFGQVVLGGRTPLMPVAMQGVGQTGAQSAPALGVFVGS